jgi:apolipoprotein D and lipocalin family protein
MVTRRALGIALSAASVLLAACAGRPEGVAPVQGFDVARYQGRWYEIMRLDHSFERGLTNVTADYAPGPDGTIAVLNRGLDRSTCTWEDAEGTATFQGSPDVASLSVTFFWPFAGAYNVFALDRDDYAWAVVAGPSRDYLWILARRPDLSPEIRDRLVGEARALGFPVDQLILVDQSQAPCPAAPAG